MTKAPTHADAVHAMGHAVVARCVHSPVRVISVHAGVHAPPRVPEGLSFPELGKHLALALGGFAAERWAGCEPGAALVRSAEDLARVMGLRPKSAAPKEWADTVRQWYALAYWAIEENGDVAHELVARLAEKPRLEGPVLRALLARVDGARAIARSDVSGAGEGRLPAFAKKHLPDAALLPPHRR